ncbi:uncharacterized protein BXZ73DRAFT_76725 [Epithele typhae]|uniref:uncharacterized protein n=1 Tax=Epithele typhae TaxID=378194 RepID=UPI002007ED55|nr:uncharacterized protein BXZ73DRAFT_76725 [Epithele typhae]KAH9935909.1 hypothetical protein BXZ73DRAFT_76725 [Epithele typhae]
MASNLYEILGIKQDATSEEVRKAYRKMALQTHPDRLPQSVTAEEKKAAEERFRLVNNAYEVLNDTENRKLYDKHEQTSRSSDPFTNTPFANNPFFSRPSFANPRGRGAFTDPFELFNALFGDFEAAFVREFGGTPFMQSPFDDPFFRSQFGASAFHTSPFGHARDPFGGPMFGGSPFNALIGAPMLAGRQSVHPGISTRIYSSNISSGGNGHWVSTSTSMRSINGRTETITRRFDPQGNEHVTYSSPEGDKYTVNGVEQRSGSPEDTRHSNGVPRQPPAPADASRSPAAVEAPKSFSVPIAGYGPTSTSDQNGATFTPVVPNDHHRRHHHSIHSHSPAEPVDPRAPKHRDFAYEQPRVRTSSQRASGSGNGAQGQEQPQHKGWRGW